MQVLGAGEVNGGVEREFIVCLHTQEPTLSKEGWAIREAQYKGYAPQRVTESTLRNEICFPESAEDTEVETLSWFSVHPEGEDSLKVVGELMPGVLVAAENTIPVLAFTDDELRKLWKYWIKTTLIEGEA